jgi:hypothetical protein
VTTIIYRWIGLDGMIDEVERVGMLDESRSYEMTGPLEDVLHDQFDHTQARVASPEHPHVPTYMPTGALASSGRTHSWFDGSTWEGDITYGGRSYDVEYAIYEMARGGVHDWYAGLGIIGEGYREAMHDYWEHHG